jgi:hypothetical protein
MSLVPLLPLMRAARSLSGGWTADRTANWTARDAVVGQAKNRSPVRDGFEKFPQMFRRAKTGVLGQICLKIPVNNSVFFGQ